MKPSRHTRPTLRAIALATVFALTFHPPVAEARKTGMLSSAAQEVKDVFNGREQDAPTVPLIEVGFSPEGTAETLVLKFIGSQKKQLYVMGYAFTAQNIVSALISAKVRGVQVAVVLDYRENKNEHSANAIERLIKAGIPVRSDHLYPIFHDKVMIGDMKHVQTGSFNYTAAAERKNSENAMVLWNQPNLANTYYGHFKTRWEESPAYSGN